MKKVIMALAIVSISFAACNSGDKKTDGTKTDSTAAVKKDTAVMAPKADTTKMAPAADTSKKK